MKRLARLLLVTVVPPLVALVVAFGLGALLILATPALSRMGAGDPLPAVDPWQVYRVMIEGALGSVGGRTWVLYHATPLILAGLSVALAFRVGLFNIGGHGQMVVGGLAATLVGIGPCAWIARTFPAAVAPWAAVLLCATAAIAAGGLWGALAGVLKAYRGAHEVITTIMLNFIALSLTQYLVTTHYLAEGSGVIQTFSVAEVAWLPRLSGLWSGFDAHTPLSPMLFVALAAAVLAWVGLRATVVGYELRTVGHNAGAAEYAGISSRRATVLAMTLAGGLAGLASLALIHGDHHVFGPQVFVGDYGFLGIAVALVARSHPLGVVPAALLFGFLFQGTTEIAFETQLPKDVISILQGLVIVCVVVAYELFGRWFGEGRG